MNTIQQFFFRSLIFLIAFNVFQIASASQNSPIVRVLDGTFDEFTFSAEAGQILFAEIKADVYQDQGRMGGDHDDSSGGCSDTSLESGCDDGCSDDTHAGHGDLCLQVLYATDKLCWAGRPDRPGWQRDPRLACPLPYDGEYVLRVFIGSCGSTDTMNYVDADNLDPKRFYRLFVEVMDSFRDGQEIPKQK